MYAFYLIIYVAIQFSTEKNIQDIEVPLNVVVTAVSVSNCKCVPHPIRLHL